MTRNLNSNGRPRLIYSMSSFYDSDWFICPICKVTRPEEHHLDWCTYDGPELPETE